MNAFEQLEKEHPKEFKVVFNKLSKQMMYSEACILLDVLQRKDAVSDYESKWQFKFKEWLQVRGLYKP